MNTYIVKVITTIKLGIEMKVVADSQESADALGLDAAEDHVHLCLKQPDDKGITINSNELRDIEAELDTSPLPAEVIAQRFPILPRVN